MLQTRLRAPLVIVMLSLGCGGKSTQPKAGPGDAIDEQPEIETPAETQAKPNAITPSVHTISLQGDMPVPVSGTEFRVQISGSYHKTSTPLVGVSILVSRGDDQQAEVEWRIKLGEVDSTWRPIKGNRYDAPSKSYMDEEIPGWQVRLDSVDAESVGGDPTAITVSFRPAP